MRILGLLGVALMLTTSAGAQADQTDLINVVTPVYQGYAISIDLPESADWERTSGPGKIGAIWLGDRTREGAHKDDYPRIDLRTYVRLRPMPFDAFVKVQTPDRREDATIVYEQGVDDTFGQPTLYYTSSDEACSVDGQTVACDEPRDMTFTAILRDLVDVEIRLSTQEPEDFERFRPLFQRIARTVRIIPERDLDPRETSAYYENYFTASFARSRSYFLESHLSIWLPPGWSAEEAELRDATEHAERGRMVLAFHDGSAPKGLSEPYEAFFVIVEGLPVSALTRSDYLATAAVYVSNLLDQPTEVETPEALTLPAQHFEPGGFCLSKSWGRFSDGTGGVRVRTYTGRNDDDGRPLKLRVYTAGGMTHACNLIYVADPEIFDVSQGLVDRMVSSLRLQSASPSLLYKNRLVTLPEFQ